MKKRWQKFNFGEWRSDVDLARCSRAARSLWLDMVGLIYAAEDGGRLTIKGAIPTDKDLSDILGDDPRTIRRLIAELEKCGVFDLDDDGCIKSRRIAREELQAKMSEEYGKRGGNPALKNKAKAEKRVNPQKPEPKPDIQKEDDADASSARDPEVKPHLFPMEWELPAEWLAWALEYRTPQNQNLTEAEIRNEADSFADYWRGRRDAKAKRPGWFGTFRARIREQAPRIVATRIRAERDLQRTGGAPRRSNGSRDTDLFEALAYAAHEASDRPAGPERDGLRPGAGELLRLTSAEVIDFGDSRGAGARYAGGDREGSGPPVRPLPASATG